MNWRILLLPLSGLYWIAMSIRDLAFRFGVFPSQKFSIPVVCVGNLSVGGTGKSPHVMLVGDIMKDYFETSMLSRGYGRKTSGLEIANYHSRVYDVGDEPLQFFNRFKNKIVVAVCANRVFAINHLMKFYKTEAVLMDDGFQHRSVKPGFSILLTTFDEPYFKDFLLPGGNLREPRSAAGRADVIIVTKCPENFSVKKYNEILAKIKPKKHQQVYFSKIVYSDEAIGYRFNLHSDEWSDFEAILITGIANSTPFVDFVSNKFKKIHHLNFSDHYNFSMADVQMIDNKYEDLKVLNKIILTTEKDYMRLKDESALIENLFYIPIEVELNDYDGFKKNLLNYVGKN